MDFFSFLDRNGFGVFLFCLICGPVIINYMYKGFIAVLDTIKHLKKPCSNCLRADPPKKHSDIED
jgi:hypothetical protein